MQLDSVLLTQVAFEVSDSQPGCLFPVRFPMIVPPMLTEPTWGMNKRQITEAIPAWASPALPRSASGVEKPGHIDERLATVIGRHRTRDEKRACVQCYNISNSSGRCNIKSMWEMWTFGYPTSTLMVKQLASYSITGTVLNRLFFTIWCVVALHDVVCDIILWIFVLIF